MKNIDEMRKKLQFFCDCERDFECRVCPLKEIEGNCFPADEEKLKRNYELVFGKEETKMTEITRVITARFTFIEKVEDDFNEAESKDWVMKNAPKAYKEALEADHAEIVEVQDFIMDAK